MFKEKLNQIRILLGMEVKLADEQLTDGSAISAEKFEVGYPVFTKALLPLEHTKLHQD